MPDTRTLPDERLTRAQMLRRIDALERRLAFFETRFSDEVEFSLPGTISVKTSGRHYPRASTRLREAFASLDVPGVTATVVGIYRNAVLLDSLTLAANSDLPVVLPFSALYGKDQDYIQVGVITAGAGATALTVQCRFG